MGAQTGNLQGFLEVVGERARESGLFADVRVEEGRLSCRAKASAERAFYRIEEDEGGVWVSLVMEDRWLSESIEAGLMHSGDKLEELLEEELVDQGYEGEAPAVQHFRSDDMLFTFRSRLPFAPSEAGANTEAARQWLVAYEQCFSQLGDMSEEEDD